ncbi:sulfite reductase flavoprotein alpha-component [Moniliophthora roreri]|nr:sulfite reductase flavoprotein alpha-component [Moniliophthora roreri]
MSESETIGQALVLPPVVIGYGPRGCAWLGSPQPSGASLYGAPQGPNALQTAIEKEKKTICEVLLPKAPPKDLSSSKAMLQNADSLNPPELDVLAVALGAPARRVLERADTLGAITGWRDGFLSTKHGLCPADPNASPAALALTPGRVWSDLCARLPGLIARGRVREAILELPLVDGSPETIPDAALWASVVCLGILASIWRYEENNDGHEGIKSLGARKELFYNIQGEPDEEPETKGIPRSVVIPFRQVCVRLGRPLPYLSQSDVSLHNYKIRDPTSVYPYLARAENMDLRWPIFNDRGEAMFLLCMAEVHGLFTPGPDLMARCQERVMEKDNDGLLVELLKLKEVIDQLPYVFHKISVNPHAGENFAPPATWGQGYAKFSAPLSKRLPALSGLFLPIFQCMDTFLMRQNYKSFLGIESIHLRAWMPLNVRAFLAAIENHYPVVPYVKASGDPRLIGVLDAIVESYAGEKGFMGTHRYKVYGFLEVVAKTGRVETNGGAGSTDEIGRPWQEVHRTLAASMKERLEPYRSKAVLDVEPHEMRGTYDECRFWAKITNRQNIDDDEKRTTGKVTFDLHNIGLTFIPGDRLAIMPMNSWSDIEKVVGALGLVDLLDVNVPLDAATPAAAKWRRYAQHEAECSKLDERMEPRLTVRDVLRKGKLAPLTKEMVMNVHTMIRTSSTTLRVLSSDSWPVNGSLGDLLILALNEVAEQIWDQAFSLDDLSWLLNLVAPEVPRTYSISSFPFDLMPESLDLTVARSEHQVSSLLLPPDSHGLKVTRPGVSSGFLNPDPTIDHEPKHHLTSRGYEEEKVLVGVSRPLNFQLPLSPAAPVAMFAGGSGIAPFRGFWQARIGSGVIGRNILFLGVQSRQKFLYKHELREYVTSGKLELHVAFSRDSSGLVYDPVQKDLVEKHMEPRYIDQTIVDQGPLVCDMVISTKLGGHGGYLYVCGSLSLYETVMKGIRQALYKYRAVTKEGADEMLAQAFAERRFMLDVFMTPRVMSENEQYIPLSELARHTGHREGSKMWIGVHGCVYDVTDFLPIHPGGTMIVAGSAGLDASVTFDEVAHTSNPEVMSLLGKYFIGYLMPKPSFQMPEINDLYDLWVDYMRTCVESLTTLYFEVDTLKKDAKTWFSGGLLSTHAIRKFYQLQSRLLTKTGFPVLFGSKLQELYLQLSFSIANSDDQSLLPDVVGIITHATSSPAAIHARKEIAELGEFVSNAATSAPAFERGIITYTRNVLDLDVQFLEYIREDICSGYEAFIRVGEVIKRYPTKEKQALHKISTVLMSFLQRIAERVESFYVDLAAQSLYDPMHEANPARARWRFVARRIKDSSFFVLTKDINVGMRGVEVDLTTERPLKASNTFETVRNKRQSVSFDQVLSQAVSTVSKAPAASRRGVRRMPSRQATLYEEEDDDPRTPRQAQPAALVAPRPLRLADAHTARAKGGKDNATSFEEQISARATNRMSTFMQGRMKDIKRLSRSMNGMLSLDHALTVYGRGGNGGSQPHSESEFEDHSSSGGSSPVDFIPRATVPASMTGSRTHSRASSRQESLDRLNGVPRSRPTTPGGMSRKDLQNATFGRKLSVYGGSRSGGSRAGDSPSEKVPPVPVKPSHW